jgi:hypothetical protein
MAKLLLQHLDFRSAIDFGCGNGYLLAALAARGINIMGVDGSENVLKYYPDAVIRDLTQPLDIGKYDLVICTEVAEHIEECFADTLVDTVCRTAIKHIFFSAAKAGYGGHLHVNEQERPYWYEKFAKRGWAVDHKLSEEICAQLKVSNPQTWWFANNCFVLHRDQAKVAIVVGGGLDWQNEVEKAKALCAEANLAPTFFVVNDHIASFPGDVVGCTLHPDKLRNWLPQRVNSGLGELTDIWTHTGAKHLATKYNQLKDWGGSSGLFAYQVARERGFNKIIFCGVPMDASPNYFRKQNWTAVSAFTRSWQTHKTEIQKYGRSMSGWTAEQIGQATLEWLKWS